MFDRFILSSLKIFFHYLYHQFAWSYDFVSWAVSMGRWQSWVTSVLEVIENPDHCKVLELGYGPGHLQLELNRQSISSTGIDESPWMSRQASRRLKQNNYPQKLVTGIAQSLPFTSGNFNYVIATFPSEYIFSTDTLKEVYRVLNSNGTFVVLPFAWITGKQWTDRITAWLFRITGQSPSASINLIENDLTDPFIKNGFRTSIHRKDMNGSVVLMIEAKKKCIQ